MLVGGDIVGRQVTVHSGGLVAMHAYGDIDLQAGRTTAETDSATQSTSRKLLGGTTTTTRIEQCAESVKGKARKPYEFGVKVSIATTLKEGLVVGMRSMPGNP